MSLAQYWLVAAIVLFIMEIITPGFVLANFGVGALASATAAWFGASVTIQVIVFCVVCLASFFTLRPFMNKFIFRNQARFSTGTDALMGAVGVVTTVIDKVPVGGRVQLGDDWHAIAESGDMIEVGTRVKVVRIDSTTLIVQPQPTTNTTSTKE